MYGRRPLHSSCAAMVWPTAQMSSRSPSTVSNMVRRMARGSTRSPRHVSFERQRVFLKHQPDGFEIELRRKVQHGKILIVKGLGDLGLLDLAVAEVLVKLPVGLDVPLDVHAHEGSELHKPRIDPPECAGISHRHDRDQVLLEP